nr:SET domain-containing protein-lysine N-methyltransferase [Candidatus Sigynarchaeum springense]MDO8116507.1 SET domain-containing protein-lysine N-methyltransferase [Candidatus Sigynarchaeota archaeon]
MLEIKQISAEKGRGAFATRDIKVGEIIDIANVIIITAKEFEYVGKTVLNDYVFDWGDPDDPSVNTLAIAMSPCEFCNHSYTPNARYKHDYVHKTIVFFAIKEIKKGEEITVNYNCKPEDMSPLWFTVKDAAPPQSSFQNAVPSTRMSPKNIDEPVPITA